MRIANHRPPTIPIGRCLVPLLLATLCGSAGALLHIDFEQPYYVHDSMQVWDHCLVCDNDIYYIFYHGIPESNPHPDYADHIWRASSADLIHWTAPIIVLSVSTEPHEVRSIWAPDVVFDEGSGLWWMSYTGVDIQRNQRICMASSPDLQTWTKTARNPVLEPDPTEFFYFPEYGWAECRDPFLFRQNGQWQMLTSAKVQGIDEGRGAFALSTSDNLIDWSTTEVFFTNESETPVNPLESPQYLERDGFHHLFFHQYTTQGVTHVVSSSIESLHIDDGVQIDLGIAPEVDTFDGGRTHLFTRIAPFQEPDLAALSYVARIDTLMFRDGLQPPQIYRFPPLSRSFEDYGGNACLGNPCFGDNPARRGEDPVGMQGDWWFGSREYFQGPLSGRGAPGTLIGETAWGHLNTSVFVIEGSSMSLLVGGSYSPDHCFVALMDAAADTILRHATGADSETMTRRYWDLADLIGRSVYLHIEDSDPEGHINVDHIMESHDVVTAVSPGEALPVALVVDLGPRPNPFNPSTELRFELTRPVTCRIRIHDVRGHQIWTSTPIAGRTGLNAVTWTGIDRAGGAVAGGVYMYSIEAEGRTLARGKITLLP